MVAYGQDITGEPRWDLARESVARLRTMPPEQAEANIQGLLFSILGFLFPNLPQSELTLEKASGDGPIDVYCRNVVFETKRTRASWTPGANPTARRRRRRSRRFATWTR